MVVEATLVIHPASGPSPVAGITVQMERRGVSLWLRFTAVGEIDAVEWPAAAPQGRTDDLWRHTCFEAFVSTDDGYVEYNLSPSSQWASYRFDGWRAGMRAAEEAATVLGSDGAFDHVALEARIELPPGAQRLAVSAVIEDRSGSFTYWALNHSSDKPDFHHPNSFVLELP